MKTGFTLGKYAPFHKGHQYVLSTALEEMDHVIAIVYNASRTTSIPTSTRAAWIRETLPDVEVILADDGPEDTGYTPEIIDTQNAYLLRLLDGRKIDAFYSSEPYGASVSAAFGCANRLVDPDRARWPVSATVIRGDPARMGEYLPPCVFRTLKPKVYFVGAPSTGKSTLARHCADAFGGNYCDEFGRDYWFAFQKDHRLSMEDLEAIAVGHNLRENLAFASDRPVSFHRYVQHHHARVCALLLRPCFGNARMHRPRESLEIRARISLQRRDSV